MGARHGAFGLALLLHGCFAIFLSLQATSPLLKIAPAVNPVVIQAVVVDSRSLRVISAPIPTAAPKIPEKIEAKPEKPAKPDKPEKPVPAPKVKVAPPEVAIPAKDAAEKAKAKAEAEKLAQKRLAEKKAQEEKAKEAKLLADKKQKAFESALREAAQREKVAQEAYIASEVDKAIIAIRQQVSQAWLRPVGLADLSCTLEVRVLPSGDVVSAQVSRSSGHSAFDRSAESAVRKASPLPMPEDLLVREQLREFRLTFSPGDAL